MSANDDFSSDISTTGTLSPGGQISGVFQSSGDSDWFKISLTTGNYYRFEFSSADKTYRPFDQEFSIYDSSGNATWGPTSRTVQDVELGGYKPSVSGDYYIAVKDRFGGLKNPVPYTLRADMGTADLVGESVKTAAPMTLDQTVHGTFDFMFDADVYKLTLPAGTTYVVTPDFGAVQSGQYINTDLRLEDNANTLAVLQGNQSPTLSFATTVAGDYYIRFAGDERALIAPLAYALTVTKAEDDFIATAATTGSIALNTDTAGRLETEGDRDWFATTLEAGNLYWLKLNGLDGVVSYGATIKLFDGDSKELASQTVTYGHAAPSLTLPYAATRSGTYYVEVSDYFNATSKYSVSTALGTADDHGNTYAAATAVSSTGKVTGNIELQQDTDVFKFAVTKGKTYLFAFNVNSTTGTAAPSLSGSSGTGYDPDKPTWYDKPGVKEYWVYNATYTGTYYLTVKNAEFGTASYSIDVTEAAADDYGNSRSTSGVLGIGEKASGNIDYTGDSDLLKVTLESGVKYAFTLRGAGSGDGTLALNAKGTDLKLQASDSAISIPALQYKGNGVYVFTPNVKGDYYAIVRKGPFDATDQNDATGSYTLQATSSAGTAGNDYLGGQGTGIGIDGGKGMDTVLYDGYRSNYSITRGATEVAVQRSGGNGSGVADKLANVERLLFDDTAVALDIDGIGGQAYRLYQAAFNRAPDKAGIGYWIGQMDKGAGLRDVAQSFIISDEFRTLYGPASGNVAFVETLYQNVLHRTGEQAGVDYWNKVLADGTSRADVLAFFSESPENQAAVLKVIGNGFDYTPYG